MHLSEQDLRRYIRESIVKKQILLEAFVPNPEGTGLKGQWGNLKSFGGDEDQAKTAWMTVAVASKYYSDVKKWYDTQKQILKGKISESKNPHDRVYWHTMNRMFRKMAWDLMGADDLSKAFDQAGGATGLRGKNEWLNTDATASKVILPLKKGLGNLRLLADGLAAMKKKGALDGFDIPDPPAWPAYFDKKQKISRHRS